MVGEIMFAKKVIDKVRGNGSNDNEQFDSKRRLGRGPKLIAGVAILGTAAASIAGGVARGIERNPVIVNESVAQGGEAEIISFDADFEAHCWTATTIQATGAGMKDEVKALGASVGWQEFALDTQIKNNVCIDGISLVFEVNTGTGHVNIDIPNKDSIKTQTEVVVGTINTREDQTVGYMFADNITNFFESVPFLEDTGLSKDMSAGQDRKKAAKMNTALVLALKLALDNCAKETWSLASQPVEKGIKRMVTTGLHIAKATYPEIDPNNVSLTVEGKPFEDLKVAGNTSNIDAAYESIKKFDTDNENFTILQPSGSCEVSDEVKKLPADPKTVVKALNNEGVTNE